MWWSILNKIAQEAESCFPIFLLHEEAIQGCEQLLGDNQSLENEHDVSLHL